MRILGIDPGTRRVGYGFLEGLRSWKGIRHGRIEARGDLPDRLVWIVQELRRLMGDLRPDIVAIEEAFYGKDVRSALRLGESRGAILATVRERGIPVFQFPPAVVKRSVTGNGNAAKGQVASMVERLLGEGATGVGADAADALAVAICCANRYKGIMRARVRP